ncbi:MAG: hypothetical protein JW814_05150 [Candidatus Krumholzibacteriota bacterium]|nr:hypothetical protein [Candidatus Krumholzibacteriota bacterium]
MKDIRKLAMALALFSLLAGVALTATAQATDSPMFFVREKTVDLGNFYEGLDIAYDFTVRNNGVGELHITSVRPG